MRTIIYRVSAVYLLLCFFVLINLFAGVDPFPYSIYLLFTTPIAAATLLYAVPPTTGRTGTIMSRLSGIFLFVGSVGVSSPFLAPMLCYVFYGLRDASICSNLFVTYAALLVPSILVLLLSMVGFFTVNWRAWKSRSPDPVRRRWVHMLTIGIVCVLAVVMAANYVRNAHQAQQIERR